MRPYRLLALLIFGSTGCFDLKSLQSGTSDMAMAMTTPDLRQNGNPDMRMPVDMAIPTDLATPPDQLPPAFMWTPVTPALASTSFFAISGIAASGPTVYVVGEGPAVYKASDGTTFIETTKPIAQCAATLKALWVKDASEVWIADAQGKVCQTTNSGVSWTDQKTMATMSQNAIFGRSSTDVLVGGDDTTKGLYGSGTSFAWASANFGIGQKVHGVWIGTSTYVAVGEGAKAATASMPSGTWTSLPNMGINGGSTFTAVFGTAENNVWATTSAGDLASADFTAMTPKLTRRARMTGENFLALWVKSDTEVWVTTDKSKVYMWDGSILVDKSGDLPTGLTLTGIWGNGSGQIWVIGNTSAGKGAIFKH